METRTAYCSACDRQVRIAVTDVPVHGGQANLQDAGEVVCLDFGQHCTGELCPMFGLPRILMAVRLARSGLEPTEPWQTLRAACDGCGRVSDLEVLDESHAFCTVCGTVNRYVILELEDGPYVATGPRADTGAKPPAS